MKAEERDYKDRIEDMSDEQVRRQQEDVKGREMPEIRTVDFVYDAREEVTYEYPEMTAVCPMTGIPDFYTLRMTYVPEERLPELKSLRFYLLAYRDLPIFHEHLACKIRDDFVQAVEPRSFRLELDVGVRGGIHTVVKVETPGADSVPG
jgi:7-cyano-7-deazaguanine reductase